MDRTTIDDCNDRCDSGISSSRSVGSTSVGGSSSISGDERSASHSSSEDHNIIDNNNINDFINTNNHHNNIKVWRDPKLLYVAEQNIRHVDSVQHQTLLMSHPPGHSARPPPMLSPHPLISHSHQLLAPSPVYSSQIPDMPWKQRYPNIPVAASASHLHPDEYMDRERVYMHDRERHERLQREREQEREIEKQKERDREKIHEERERERENFEKQRAEQAVLKHFEESLRFVHQKKGNWNVPGLSSQVAVSSSAALRGEGERKRLEQEHRRLRHSTENEPPPPTPPNHHREREKAVTVSYSPYASLHPMPMAKSSGSSNVGKSDYMSSVNAHSRLAGNTVKSQIMLPKSEATFNAYGYPAYQGPLSFLHQDGSKMKTDGKNNNSNNNSTIQRDGLMISNNNNMDNSKNSNNNNNNNNSNSVIVKNEGNKRPHSSSPKLRLNEHYLQVQSNLKSFEYRSPCESPLQVSSHGSVGGGNNTISPHQLHPDSNKLQHHRQQQQHRHSPHHHHRQSPQPPTPQLPPPSIHHRHSPHSTSMQQQQQQPTSVNDSSRYPVVTLYPKHAAPYASGPPPNFVNHAPPPPLHHPIPIPVIGPVKGKHPPLSTTQHLYGKPTSGITTGTPISRTQEITLSAIPLTSKALITPSPYQQLSHLQLPPTTSAATANLAPPPPAHVVRTSSVLDDLRLFPLRPTSVINARPTTYDAPNSRIPSPSQIQPLDLGTRDTPTPKRKRDDELEEDNKRYCPSDDVVVVVREPSPLTANSPTTIITVSNNQQSESPPPSDESSSQLIQPAPSCSPSLSTKTTDGDSNSSSPKVPSFKSHKLKNKWLQRHSGGGGSGSGVDTMDESLSSRNTTSSTTSTSTSENGGNRTGTPNSGKDDQGPDSNNSSCRNSPILVNSLNNIGSMAINSVSKIKAKGKNKTAKESSSSSRSSPAINGNVSSPKGGGNSDYDSSSDVDSNKTSPKRVQKKVKRKNHSIGRRNENEDGGKRKKSSSTSSESDKESGSDKDSDNSVEKKQIIEKEDDNKIIVHKENAKKRGRKPKVSTSSSKNDTSSGRDDGGKKSKETKDPFQILKPPIGQLKRTGESFLQDGPCFEVAPKLAKCRECRWTPNQRSRNNIFCRFYGFRRLRYTKNGQLAIAGFSDPHKDASEADLSLWLPNLKSPPSDLDAEMARFMLTQVGDQFCDLLVQESEALEIHVTDEKKIAWKRVVQGVREMCDVCETTLFNFHWACGKCGFVVCIDCYKGRQNGLLKSWSECGKDRDDVSWLLCTNKQAHEQEKLMLTQIIAGDALKALSKTMHETRAWWAVPMYCSCPLSNGLQPNNGAYKDILKNIKKEEDSNQKDNHPRYPRLTDGLDIPQFNGQINNNNNHNKENKEENHENEQKQKLTSSDSEKPLLLNNWLPDTTTSQIKKEEAFSSVMKEHVPSDEYSSENFINNGGGGNNLELKHFIRRYNQRNFRGKEPVPIRAMTLTESRVIYPDVPHGWLCDGKLLRLLDSTNPGNYPMFQDQWKRGQPVIVSDVTKELDASLWSPESFIKDFGDQKNDLINCITGSLVTNQPMRKFWEGFEYLSKRLKDDKNNGMLLKLKDWPPGEDFAEVLPTRYNDLMKALPMREYTFRNGKLNLASRLPDCFVRPDLGPKMYNAYGSALHPSKGTTNLHLDVSDAVNVMVYVGIPKDGDFEEHIKEAYRAIDDASCDILTRRRVREKGELPGAIWHIYPAKDADKIRDLLNKVSLEQGNRLEPHHDPIHDQSWYLDNVLRERLYREYKVEGYAIVQCMGDAVFIPAGAPHQVRNLHNCIKVAEDFVSPENVSHCFHLTQEFRYLSDTHTNHEDKLQIKNIIFHAVKDSLAVLNTTKEKYSNRTRIDDDDDDDNQCVAAPASIKNENDTSD